MSIEIWQFPNAASKLELLSCLKELGYTVGENVFLNLPVGTVHLYWSEPEDFKSTRGVDASVFPVDGKAKEIWETGSDWGLRTRTSMWATSFDQEFQNQTVKTIRKKFGGHFYNDHYGKGRYNVIKRTKSTPSSRGVYATFFRLDGDLHLLESAIPDAQIEKIHSASAGMIDVKDTTGLDEKTKKFVEFSKLFDPSRIVYNALVPFLVAVIEHFFRECFEIVLKYDTRAMDRVLKKDSRVLLREAVAIQKGELSVERVVSNAYSFQNVDSIRKAYSEVLNIEVLKALRGRRRIGNKLPLMESFLRDLISTRHRVIHHLEVYKALDRKGFLALIEGTRTLLTLSVKQIERALGVELGPG